MWPAYQLFPDSDSEKTREYNKYGGPKETCHRQKARCSAKIYQPLYHDMEFFVHVPKQVGKSAFACAGDSVSDAEKTAPVQNGEPVFTPLTLNPSLLGNSQFFNVGGDAFDLILFDLDGLLVDTERLHWKAYQMMCQRFGCVLEWDFLLYMSVAGGSAHGIHKRMEQEIPQLFNGRSWEELYAVKKEILFELLTSSLIPLMPGVEECVLWLAAQGLPMVVVTHSPRKVVEMVQTAHPVLGLMSGWISREMYENPKPSPDGYLKACCDLKIAPQRALWFEDTLRGVDSLIAAGCHPVFVNANDSASRDYCHQKGVVALSSLTEVKASSLPLGKKRT